LRNKNYHIFNKPHTKEEYLGKIKEFNLGSFGKITSMQREFQTFSKQFPRRFANLVNCVNTTGDNVKNSKNAHFCFDGTEIEDSKFFTWVYMGIKDSYDIGAGSGLKAERLYECWDTNSGSNIKFSGVIYDCYDLFYCWNCHGSNNLFGCYGLRNKEYCILNRQYSKKEYEELVPKIIKHMNAMPYIDKKKRTYKYGEFFPTELSLFAYNETIAQEYFPLTKEQAVERGFSWRDPETKHHKPTIGWESLPDNIKDVEDSITKEIILCKAWDEDSQKATEHNCTKAFKIIPDELEFHGKMNLPLPRYCPNSRHYLRLKQRNPFRLWHRRCTCDYKVYQNTTKHASHPEGRCPNEFETPYSPEKPEITYCEQCYNAEIV
jgi:hypothetical protein